MLDVASLSKAWFKCLVDLVRLVVWNMFFPYSGNSNPNWLVFFRGAQATHQLYYAHVLFEMWDENQELASLSTTGGLHDIPWPTAANLMLIRDWPGSEAKQSAIQNTAAYVADINMPIPWAFAAHQLPCDFEWCPHWSWMVFVKTSSSQLRRLYLHMVVS